MNKQFFVATLFVGLVVSAFGACTRSESTEGSSDVIDTIKCGITRAGDSINTGYEATKEKVKEGVSSVTSSDTFGKISGWFSKASESVKSAASKAGEVISDGYTKTVEATKDSYAAVKDTIVGQPASSNLDLDGQERLDVRATVENVSISP